MEKENKLYKAIQQSYREIEMKITKDFSNGIYTFVYLTLPDKIKDHPVILSYDFFTADEVGDMFKGTGILAKTLMDFVNANSRGICDKIMEITYVDGNGLCNLQLLYNDKKVKELLARMKEESSDSVDVVFYVYNK